MNNLPIVSVITVVYNDVNHIEDTITNVLKQTYPRLEYIVIDGGSTDGTREVIDKYKEKIKTLSEPDNGIYDAMMKGARMASGEWLLFRNCGDYFFHSSSIEHIFSKDCDYEGVDLILADARLFNQWGYCDIKPPILTSNYMERMPVLHPSTFIRKELQLKYPFHLEYRNSADYCFFVETLQAGAKYDYRNEIIALVDCAEGATAEHYDRSLMENIKILKGAGASAEIIAGMEKVLKRQILANKVTRFIPFYGYYKKKQKLKDGWVKCDRKSILADI